MSDRSAIQWTDATWNPTTGCTKISPGCAHCYIERTPAFRIAGRTFVNGHIPLELHRARLERPLHWKHPRMVFVNSLSDLFHDDVPDAFIARVFATMAATPRHTYQVLTKRPERMCAVLTRTRTVEDVYAAACQRDASIADAWRWPLPNVWLGVSVENQHFADERIPLLLQTPAAVRFISAEPLLGPVDLRRLNLGVQQTGYGRRLIERDALTPWELQHHGASETHARDAVNRGTELDWVIVGGESGPGARAFDLTWARSIIAQCRDAGVACFVKQLGAHAFEGEPENGGGGPLYGLRDRKGGDPAEWPDDLRVREFPVSTWNSPPLAETP